MDVSMRIDLSGVRMTKADATIYAQALRTRERYYCTAAAWFAAGALASCAAFAAILWLWVVPAMDAALAAVQGAVA